MAKHSWPTGVTSWEDTVKFAQLLFGIDVQIKNYSDRLPRQSSESFLLFAKGGCKAPCPFSEIATLIPAQLSEIREYEINQRNNHSNPMKSQQMLSRHRKVHYISCQVTREPCNCRTVFGADAHQGVIPTTSSLWKAGTRFEKIMEETLKKNFDMFGTLDVLPAWLMKTWQVVWNSNDHNEGHGIEAHSDKTETYHWFDPITSFSFGRGGVLTLKSTTGKGGEKMLFQEDGDVLIMAGKFQAEYLHGVPQRSE